MLANAGIPVLLLDIVPPDAKDSTDRAARNRFAQTGLETALKAGPPRPSIPRSAARLVTVGNTEDDLAKLGEVDWIVEAVFEELDVKRDLYARIEAGAHARARSSPRTRRACPRRMLLEGRSEDFRRHFLITHFFNPVRFMKLLELVAGADTDPELMRFMGEFCAEKLGKGVVYCKDTPNFIGNRIGTYGFMATIHRMLDEGYTHRGGGRDPRASRWAARARPPSAPPTWRAWTRCVHVADNLYENLPDDPQRELFRCRTFMREMVSAQVARRQDRPGLLQAGRRAPRASGDPGARSRDAGVPPAGVGALLLASTASRAIPMSSSAVARVVNGDDRAGKLAWELTADTLLYAAAVAPGDRRRHRQHRQRDALGLQLGGRPLRDVGRARRRGDWRSA